MPTCLSAPSDTISRESDTLRIHRGYSVDVGVVEVTRVKDGKNNNLGMRLTLWSTQEMKKSIFSQH